MWRTFTLALSLGSRIITGVPDDLLTTAEVAQRFRVSEETVSRWAREGILTAIPLPSGRGYRFRKSVIDAALASHVGGDAA